MKNILTVLLVAVIMFSVGFQTSKQVMQPAEPHQVMVKSYRTMFGLEKEMKEDIEANVKNGWIVKSVAMMDDDSWSKGIVVFEKY